MLSSSIARALPKTHANFQINPSFKRQQKWFCRHRGAFRTRNWRAQTPDRNRRRSPPPHRRQILASDGATLVRCKIPAGLCIFHHHLCPYLCTHYMLMEWAQLLLMNTIYFNKEWAHVHRKMELEHLPKPKGFVSIAHICFTCFVSFYITRLVNLSPKMCEILQWKVNVSMPMC